MTKRNLLKIGIVLFTSSVILFVALVVHIAIVTNPKSKPHYGVQLSRIDFNTNLDSNEVAAISTYLRSIKGVGSVMYSFEHNNLVFAHQLDIISGQAVFEKLISEKRVDAKRFLLSAEEIAQTAKCPVMNDKTMLMSLAHKIQIYFL